MQSPKRRPDKLAVIEIPAKIDESEKNPIERSPNDTIDDVYERSFYVDKEDINNKSINFSE